MTMISTALLDLSLLAQAFDESVRDGGGASGCEAAGDAVDF